MQRSALGPVRIHGHIAPSTSGRIWAIDATWQYGRAVLSAGAWDSSDRNPLAGPAAGVAADDQFTLSLGLSL